MITLLYFPLTLLAVFLPAKRKITLISGWGWLMTKWALVCCGLRYSVKGLEKLPDTPFVVLANHQSAWETMALLFLMPPHCWVLKKELLRIPVFGWGLAMSRPIAIDRAQNKAALKQLLKQGKQRIAEGLCVVIFPQGTRKSPDDIGRFNVGGAMLAVNNRVPVVPIAHNAGHFWPRNGISKHPGVIDLVIGDMIDTTDKSASQVNDLAREWIVNTLATIESRRVTDTRTRLENKPLPR